MKPARSWLLALLVGPLGIGSAAACSSGSSGSSPTADAGGTDSSVRPDGSTGGDSGGDGAASDATSEEQGDAGSDVADSSSPDVVPVEAGPPPVVLVADAPNAYLVATDGTNVYWIDWVAGDAGQQNGRVMQVGVDGGNESTLASLPAVVPVGLAVDDARVYWTGSDRGVWQIAKDGGAPVQLAAGAAPQLAVQGGTVYFCPAGDAGVLSVAATGGAVTTVASTGAPLDLAVAAGNVYWADANGHILYVPVAAGPDGGAPAILVEPDDGGPTEYVSPTLYQNLCTDGTSLYWPRMPGSTPGAVLAVAATGGPPRTVDAVGTDTPMSVATDGTGVYFLDVAGATALVAVPLDGGAPHTLTTAHLGSAAISGTPGPTVAVDSTSVYWLNPPEIAKTTR